MRVLLPLVLIFVGLSVRAEPQVVTGFSERARILAALALAIKHSDDDKLWVCETMKSGSVSKAAIAALQLAQFGDRQPGSGVVIPRLLLLVNNQLTGSENGKLPEINLNIDRVDGSLAKYRLHFALSESGRSLVSFSYEMLPAKIVNTGGILESQMKMINVAGEGQATCWARIK